jgi:hypothetical protein
VKSKESCIFARVGHIDVTSTAPEFALGEKLVHDFVRLLKLLVGLDRIAHPRLCVEPRRDFSRLGIQFARHS